MNTAELYAMDLLCPLAGRGLSSVVSCDMVLTLLYAPAMSRYKS